MWDFCGSPCCGATFLLNLSPPPLNNMNLPFSFSSSIHRCWSPVLLLIIILLHLLHPNQRGRCSAEGLRWVGEKSRNRIVCECAYTRDNKDAVTISWKGNPEKRRMEERPNKTKFTGSFQTTCTRRQAHTWIHISIVMSMELLLMSTAQVRRGVGLKFRIPLELAGYKVIRRLNGGRNATVGVKPQGIRSSLANRRNPALSLPIWLVLLTTSGKWRLGPREMGKKELRICLISSSSSLRSVDSEVAEQSPLMEQIHKSLSGWESDGHKPDVTTRNVPVLVRGVW